MMNLLKHLFLFLFLLPVISQAQEEVHPSYWQDEYTIRTHMTAYIANLVVPHQAIRTWDDERGTYVAYAPKGLTYSPAKGQTLDVKLATTYYHLTDYFPQNWARFSEAKMDSVFQLGKRIETGSLQYDEKGRLTHAYRKSKEHRLMTEKDEVNIQYVEKPSGSQFNIEIANKSFNWFANYQSIYVGNIKWRPLRLKANWKMTCELDAEGMLDHVVSTNEAYANGRANYRPSDYTYDFVWDEKGRMLSKNYLLKGDSLPKKVENVYIERPFDYDIEAKRYPLLQVPSIKKWLFKNFDPDDLRMVNSQVEGSAKTYLMYQMKTPVLLLDTSQYFRQFIYYTLEDSAGTSRIRAEINKMPDLTDTIPFDPYYHQKRIKFMPMEDHYVRPPGLLDAGRIDYYRRSVTPLNDGWKMIRYQRGSGVSTRFAVGYHPPVRLDVPLDKYVLVDEKGRVRYYYSYKRLYQVEWP